MHEADMTSVRGRVVEEDVHLSLAELCRACEVAEDELTVWVLEGVIEPLGRLHSEWHFGGQSLARARLGSRLSRELDINAPGIALALDLLEQIDDLTRRLNRIASRN
jgi:chaperone modulatory protein CbpM